MFSKVLLLCAAADHLESPGCGAVVQNQGVCGDCYSFASTEMLAARINLRENDLCSYGGVLSAEVPVAFWDVGGCNGGSPVDVGKMIQKNGVPEVKCAPFVSGKCAEKGTDAGDGCTASAGYKDGICYSDPTMEWHTWGIYKEAYISQVTTFKGASAYLAELTTNGPFAAVFVVYDNFFHYWSTGPGGVYTQTAGGTNGNHAVLVTGYGTDAGTPYWIVRNSWGPAWGDSGYFRIERGTNLANFEDWGTAYILAGSEPAARDEVLDAGLAGAWVDLGAETATARAARAALEAAHGSVLAVERAESQVVNGVNVRLHAALPGRRVEATLHRPAALADAAPQFEVLRLVDVDEALVV